MYYRETSIEDLYEEKKISLRTLNRFKENNIIDLGQIYNYCNGNPQNLWKLGGFGKKSIEEIKLILNNMSTSEEIETNHNHLLDEAYDYAFSLLSKNEEYILKKIYPSAFDLQKYIYKIADNNFTVFKEYSKEDNITIRKFCLNHICKMVGLIEEREVDPTFKIYNRYKKAESILSNSCEKFTLYQEALLMSHKPQLQELIQLTYEKLADKSLSQREKNIVKSKLKTFDKIVFLFDADDIKSSKKIGIGIKVKSYVSIKNVIERFKDEFLKYYEFSDDAAFLELLKFKFPFLDSNQCKFICEFKSKNGYIPLFYLLYNYIRTSEDTRNKIISYLYGFYDSRCLTMEEIALKLGITRERVRQCNEQGVDFGKGNLEDLSFDSSIKRYGLYVKKMIAENSSHYIGRFSTAFIAADFDVYKTIKEQEHLNDCFRTFAKILLILNNDFDEFDLKLKRGMAGELLLINKSLKINLSEMKKKFDAFSSERYYKDIIIHFKEFLDVGENLNEATRSLIKYIASHFYNLNSFEDGILMSQTNIDVQDELYNILKEKNYRMSLEEIFNAFKEKHPSHKYTNPQQITSFLQRDKNKKRISCIGMTSTYVLSSWHTNTDTIRDIVRKLLNNSDVPLKISEIFKEVLKSYPNSNEKSIRSSMQNETTGCFVEFQGSLWGIKGKQYSSIYKIKDVFNRGNFSMKLENFKYFVEKNHRFPISGPNVEEEERSLYRWLYNIKSGRSILSYSEKQEFDAMLKNFEPYHYPQNAREEQFMKYCNNMKEFIRNSKSLPTTKSDKDLYGWYYRAKRDYSSYTDNRRVYMEDLIDFIKSFVCL